MFAASVTSTASSNDTSIDRDLHARADLLSVPKRSQPSPPATKQDIEDFANLIGGYCIRSEQQIADLQTHMEQWKEDLHDQVQLMLDEHRRDLRDANREEIQMIKDRLRNVELRLARVV